MNMLREIIMEQKVMELTSSYRYFKNISTRETILTHCLLNPKRRSHTINTIRKITT